MTPLPMALNDLEGQFCCLKPFELPYLMKQHKFTELLVVHLAILFMSALKQLSTNAKSLLCHMPQET